MVYKTCKRVVKNFKLFSKLNMTLLIFRSISYIYLQDNSH